MAQQFFEILLNGTTSPYRRRRFPENNRWRVVGRVLAVSTGDFVGTGLRFVYSAQPTPEGASTGAISVQLNVPAVAPGVPTGCVTINHGVGGAVNFICEFVGR